MPQLRVWMLQLKILCATMRLKVPCAAAKIWHSQVNKFKKNLKIYIKKQYYQHHGVSPCNHPPDNAPFPTLNFTNILIFNIIGEICLCLKFTWLRMKQYAFLCAWFLSFNIIRFLCAAFCRCNSVMFTAVLSSFGWVFYHLVIHFTIDIDTWAISVLWNLGSTTGHMTGQ